MAGRKRELVGNPAGVNQTAIRFALDLPEISTVMGAKSVRQIEEDRNLSSSSLGKQTVEFLKERFRNKNEEFNFTQ